MGFQGYSDSYSEKGENLLEVWKAARPDIVEVKEWHKRGHIKVRGVRCGKKACRACPHAFYAYFVDSWGKEKYLGVCDKNGQPRGKISTAKRTAKAEKTKRKIQKGKSAAKN
jgi:hypothetical protein